MRKITKDKLWSEISVLSHKIHEHMKLGHDASEHIKRLEDLQYEWVFLNNSEIRTKRGSDLI